MVFASFKEAVTLPDVSDVIRAAAHQFGQELVAADVFPASMQVALAFTSAAAADSAATTGLLTDGENWLPLSRRPAHRPRIEKITVSGVDSTDPAQALLNLGNYFSHYGRVLEISPRYWADTQVHTGTWHVTVDGAAEVEGKITVAPPEIAIIGGVECIVDLPQIRRVCRVCRSSEHDNPSCRVGQQLARQGKQRQQQQQQQQKQQLKEQTAPVRRWATVAKPKASRPPKGKGKANADSLAKTKTTKRRAGHAARPYRLARR